MSNTETLNYCAPCGQHVTESLTHKRWTHHDPYKEHGWAYEDGERVEGDYCHECLRDIEILRADYQKWLEESENDDVTITMSSDDWHNILLVLNEHKKHHGVQVRETIARFGGIVHGNPNTN